MLALASQRFDLAAGRLTAALSRNGAAHARALTQLAGRLNPALLARPHRLGAQRLDALGLRLTRAGAPAVTRLTVRARLPALGVRLDAGVTRRLTQAFERVRAVDQLRRSLDPDRPLVRGFARVHHADGTIVHDAEELVAGEAVRLVFRERRERAAVIEPDGARARPREGPRARRPVANQGDLF